MLTKSILFVDDEQLILNTLTRDLAVAKPHCTIGQAANGHEAIGKIEHGQWDMIVTDLSMPGIDGFSVLTAAKRKNAQTMVIILTGFADMEAAINALRLGADDFIQKPCDSDELLYRMDNCFAKQNLQRKVTVYEHILPVCSYCKKIRNDQPQDPGRGNWFHLEEYFHKSQGWLVTHGICPECLADQMGPDRSGPP